MKTYATTQENMVLKVTDREISLSGKAYDVWKVKAEQLLAVHLTDRHSRVEVEADVVDENNLYSVDLKKEVYAEVKRVFTTQLLGVKVKKKSKISQMFMPVTLMIVVGFVTMFLASQARQLEIEGKELDKSSNESGVLSGVLRSVGDLLNELFGSSGILIVGGVITALFALMVLKVMLIPKTGAMITFKSGVGVINFAEDT